MMMISDDTELISFISVECNPKDTPPPTRVETKDERKERKVNTLYIEVKHAYRVRFCI
jgi:hypothetical protein